MRIPILLAPLTATAIAACVPAAVTAPPVAPPAPPVAAPAPPPPPPPADWRDRPLTPGAWSYAAAAGGGIARYGVAGAAAVFALRCERAAGRVRITLGGVAASALTIRTTSTARTLPASRVEGGMAATLAAGDPLLDAMGFSRGRIMVEAAGAPAALIPAHPEILRVVEDCRA